MPFGKSNAQKQLPALTLLSTQQIKVQMKQRAICLAHDFAKTTGQAVPPAALVNGNQSAFQSAIDAHKRQTTLTASPRLAQWLAGDPVKAAISKDDLDNQSWYEVAGQNLSKFPRAFRRRCPRRLVRRWKAWAS